MNPTPFDDLSEHTAAIQRIANVKCGGGAGAVSDLALALAFPGGGRLPMDIGRESMHSIIELGAMGDFHLKRVPVGKYELRIGTRAALALGGAAVTRAIELVHGEALQLEIELQSMRTRGLISRLRA